MTKEQLSELRATPPDFPSGNRLAAAFEIARVSQNDCWRATGLTPQRISDIKTAGADVRVSTAWKFANFFGCAIGDLFPDPEA